MNVKKYISCCKKFAEDTQKWGKLDGCKFYTTKDDWDWEETCDNAHGGFDVSWAFHMSAADIEKYAPQEFCEIVINILSWDFEDGFYYNTFRDKICEFMDLTDSH